MLSLHKEIKMPPLSSLWLWIGGVSFTFFIACIGYGLSIIPGFDLVGPMACALLTAVLYRQMFGYPERIRSGIGFSSKKLLRYAIILYGLKLNMDVVLSQGLGLLVQDVGTILFSLVVMFLLARWLKADFTLSLLLGIGTGVCGAAAIAAVSPIVKAKEEDTAISVGLIAFVGTLFAIGYTALRPILPLSAHEYGIWSGISLHEIAHVALATAPAGQDAIAIGLLAKLGRVFLLVPLCFLLMYWVKKKGYSDSDMKIEFPWFLIGFILMSLFNSYILDKYITVPTTLLPTISHFTTFILTMAMTGLGLNVNLKEIKTKALQPLIALILTSILLSLLTFII